MGAFIMSKISMDTVVELHNTGEKSFKSLWDSKKVEIKKGKHIEVVYGLALHFKEQSDD
jgi:argonaute-like protein implicated in RNA metabolism and viral defense